jgi:hypothetical protein
METGTNAIKRKRVLKGSKKKEFPDFLGLITIIIELRIARNGIDSRSYYS